MVRTMMDRIDVIRKAKQGFLGHRLTRREYVEKD